MIGLSLEHQAREFLHEIEMLNRCLQGALGDACRRREWGNDLRKAETGLAAVFAAGLAPDFRTPGK